MGRSSVFETAMPFFDQSVARHVGFVLSKILTPLWISSIMVNFDLSKACCRSSSQWNLLLGLLGRAA